MRVGAPASSALVSAECLGDVADGLHEWSDSVAYAGGKKRAGVASRPEAQ
jgi:hypothetical protein